MGRRRLNRVTLLVGNSQTVDGKSPWCENHDACSGFERVGHTVETRSCCSTWEAACFCQLFFCNCFSFSAPQVVLPQRCPPSRGSNPAARTSTHNPSPPQNTAQTPLSTKTLEQWFRRVATVLARGGGWRGIPNSVIVPFTEKQSCATRKWRELLYRTSTAWRSSHCMDSLK